MSGKQHLSDKLATRSPLKPRETVEPADLYTSPPPGTTPSSPAEATQSPQARKETMPLIHKYTTHLRPATIKAIKRLAVELDRKDYEIVQAALDAYLPAQG